MNDPSRRDITRRTFTHLAGLCREVAGPSSGILAPAVYCEKTDGGALSFPPASQSGYEGVACVDDAARLLVLLLTADPSQLNGIDPVRRRRIINGLVGFILHMQTPEGHFYNFILDWTGTPNTHGSTSEAGGVWWAARALRGLAWASRFDASRILADAFHQGVAALTLTDSWAEESMLMWAALDFEALHGTSCGLNPQPWVEKLIADAKDAPFPDSCLMEGEPHLWGRTQELVVARAARRSRDERGLDLARESCHEFLKPLATSGFRTRRITLPYEVSSVCRNLRTVARITADAELASAADSAALWFWGVNRVGQPMIDSVSGRASDGLDDMQPSQNSGAESNIEALFTTSVPAVADLMDS